MSADAAAEQRANNDVRRLLVGRSSMETLHHRKCIWHTSSGHRSAPVPGMFRRTSLTASTREATTSFDGVFKHVGAVPDPRFTLTGLRAIDAAVLVQSRPSVRVPDDRRRASRCRPSAGQLGTQRRLIPRMWLSVGGRS